MRQYAGYYSTAAQNADKAERIAADGYLCYLTLLGKP